MAKISLICNDSLPENETFFEYINTKNIPTDTYVSVIHLFRTLPCNPVEKKYEQFIITYTSFCPEQKLKMRSLIFN